MTSPETPALPAEGRRVAFIGPSGAGKTTLLAHVASAWAASGTPVAVLDAEDPGEGEPGSLAAWDAVTPLWPGGTVYGLPDSDRGGRSLRRWTHRLTPAGGLLAVDTGPWRPGTGTPHRAVLDACDLAVLCVRPTPADVRRAVSVQRELERRRAAEEHRPVVRAVLTMVRPTAVSVGRAEEELRAAGYRVLPVRVPLSDARHGMGESFGRRVPVLDVAARLGRELVAAAA